MYFESVTLSNEFLPELGLDHSCLDVEIIEPFSSSGNRHEIQGLISTTMNCSMAEDTVLSLNPVVVFASRSRSATSLQFPTTFVVLSTTALCLHLLYKLVRNVSTNGRAGSDSGVRRRHPPGPRGIPLLGSLLEFRHDVQGKMKQFSEEYGSIFSLKVGPTRMVILANQDLIKEAFESRAADISERPQVMIEAVKQSKGIVLSQPGGTHRRNRNFLSTAFRLISLGMPEFSRHLHPHIDDFKDKLATARGQPIPMMSITHELLFTIFAKIMIGEVPDPKSTRISELLDVLRNTLSPNPMMFLAGRVVPECIKKMLVDWVDMSDYMSRITRFLKEHVDRKKLEFNAKGSPGNLVEAFLFREASAREKRDKMAAEAAEAETLGNVPPKASGDRVPAGIESLFGSEEENEQNLAAILLDVFQAGCTSNVALVQWLLLYLAVYPDIQLRIQAEIDQALEENEGAQRPSMLLRSNKFPVTKATMLETLRLCPPAPFGAPHSVLRDTTVGGYDIAKGTLILSDIYLALRDPKKWESPDEFRPDRFLDDKGKLINTETIVFSAGPRLCPGKLLSKTITACLIVELLRDYTFHLPAGQKPELVGSAGIVYNPKPFSLIADGRHGRESRCTE